MSSPFTPLGIYSSHDMRMKMAFQVKVEYDGLVSSIRKNCSSLAHLDAYKIRLRYRDEDGDMVNVCEADLFAFSEMLRTAKEVKDRDYKKIFIQANEIDSPCPRKMKRGDFGVENSSTGDELSCLQPKQLSFHASTFPSTSFTDDARASPTSAQNDQQGCSPSDSKQQEMKDSLTVLQVQIVTAKEALQKLNQQQNEYVTLSSLRGRVCNNCHATGHTKTTCRSPPYSNVDSCKIKDKHPEHKMKVNELQREIKSLVKSSSRTRGKHQTFSKCTGTDMKINFEYTCKTLKNIKKKAYKYSVVRSFSVNPRFQ